jgi:hypothetical protein
MFVYGQSAQSTVSLLLLMGMSRKRIASVTGISVRTITRWCNGRERDGSSEASGPRDQVRRRRQSSSISRQSVLCAADLASYAYLLGLYLGDGHIVKQRRGVYQLRISMDSRYPSITGETVRAMRSVLPQNKANVFKHPVHNLVLIVCSSKALPILFPQHGPGRKHTRKIELEGWQRRITFVHAEELVRGLIHSDGCRFMANQLRGKRIYSR